MSRVNPLHIVLGLIAIVLTANAIFIYVATTKSDEVVSSYVTEER